MLAHNNTSPENDLPKDTPNNPQSDLPGAGTSIDGNHHAANRSESLQRSEPIFSYYEPPIQNTYPSRTTTPTEVYEKIRGTDLVSATEELRKIRDKKKANKYKGAHLPCVTFSGVFKTRSVQGLLQYSHMMVIDIDGLEEVETVRKILLADERLVTILLFTSPRGHGVKWVIPVVLEGITHLQMFNAIEAFMLRTYNIVVDESGKDVSRACFLAHDPTVYLNPDFEQDKLTKKFNPSEWQPQPAKAIPKPSHANEASYSWMPYTFIREDVEALITEIESRSIDITVDYPNWLKMGFAVVEGFGEAGRDIYHRLSKYYPGYSREECDKQYSNCLKANGKHIPFQMLFFYAKEAGIDVGAFERMPTFPDELFPILPPFFQKVVARAETKEERDILLLCSVAVASACSPNVSGIYDSKVVYPDLYLFIIGQASAGKGRLNHCRRLGALVHKHMKDKGNALKKEYKIALKEYNAAKNDGGQAEVPSMPPEKMLFIPANNSASGVFQLLSDNEGRGILFETEGDTLTEALKAKHGNFSDGLRKASEHEPITYYRRTDREHVEIEEPRLTVVLSGTPNQVNALIPNAENGLFSRFIYYKMNLCKWRNVFADRTKCSLNEYFDRLGEDVFKLYQTLIEHPGVTFCFTPAQEADFHSFFEKVEESCLKLYGEAFVASVRRLGQNAFRIAMTLSVVQSLELDELPQTVICDDNIFKVVKAITEVSIRQAAHAYLQLPKTSRPVRRDNLKVRFQNSLPHKFNRSEFIAIATGLGINEKTAEGYITKMVSAGLLHRDSKNHYVNAAKEESEDCGDCGDRGD